MKALIIVNPSARRGRASQTALRLRDEVESRLQSASQVHRVEWAVSRFPNHAMQLAMQAAHRGYEYIIAGGGDGTVNQVLNGLLLGAPDKYRRPAFGVLPWGSSNDFYTALKAAELANPTDLQETSTRPLDIGRVSFGDVERYSCLSVSVGLSSWANHKYLDASRWFGRRFAHIPSGIATLLNFRAAPEIKISYDHGPFQPRQFLFMAISNCRTVAGGLPITPFARIDDGRFDVCIFSPVSLPRLGILLLECYWDRHVLAPEVETIQASEIALTSRYTQYVHVDGEPVPEVASQSRYLNVTVLPSEVRILAPSILDRKLSTRLAARVTALPGRLELPARQ